MFYIEYEKTMQKLSNRIAFYIYMRKSPYQHLYKYRKNNHLNLKDVAYLLNMDEGNLSRFEVGKSQNSKALLGYHILFNLSIDDAIFKIFYFNNEEVVHRCFNLLEILENKSKTRRNQLRIRGVNAIINKLTKIEDDETKNK